MRHRVKKAKLGSDRNHTTSLLKNLAVGVIIHEKVQTTRPRAKAIESFVEKLISIGKKKEKVQAIREIEKLLQHENSSKKILEDLIKRYETRTSGFTRIIRVCNRKGDNAPLVQIELV